MPDAPHIFDLTPDRLGELVTAWGMPRFRADQVLHWVYRRGVIDPAAMTNLGAGDRKILAENLRFLVGQTVHHQHASDDTQKLLIDWAGGTSAAGGARPAEEASGDEGISGGGGGALKVLDEGGGGGSESQTECVMIPAVSRDSGRSRRTACVSSQVGCAVGCRFCASGLGGLDGNLTAGQIVQQVWQLSNLPTAASAPTHLPSPITHVVFMGMGEPLSNFIAVTEAIRILGAPWGPAISARRITLSTVGLPAQIRRLADMDDLPPVTLAISLHAPNDRIRRDIIPWARFVRIDQLIDAGRHYFDRTGREVTLEYILLAGVNDQPVHARELARVARKLRSNVNLIRYNQVAGLPFGRPDDGDVRQFQAILREKGITTHLRASRGRDIDAACGQLRHETAGSPG